MSVEHLPPLKEVISRLELSAKKSLGQNFLLDLNLTRRIAREAGDFTDSTVLEIGPGPGGLTRALLLEGARHVHVIERDPRCLEALNEIAEAAPGRLNIHIGDALDISEPDLLAGARAHIVANLPYNVGTALLIKWLTTGDWPPWYLSLTLMFQREVAERIVAKPGDEAYGRLSVISQWRTQPRILFDVNRSAFTPPPKITSSVVKFDLLAQPRGQADIAALERVTAAAFGQRRKMLRSSLKALGTDPIPLLASASIDPTCRAEQLSVEQFAGLARAVVALGQKSAHEG